MASLRRLPTLMQVAAVVLCVVAVARAQVQFGECPNYQGTEDFTREYITTMEAQNTSYVVVLTSGDPTSCQELTLFSDNTFEYTLLYENDLIYYTGNFNAEASTLRSPGYINLNLPPGVFGSNIATGNLRLYVLMAEPDYLLVASCAPVFVVGRAEQVIAMVPRSKYTADTAQALKTTLTDVQIPVADYFRVVSQGCEQTTRNHQQKLPVYVINYIKASIRRLIAIIKYREDNNIITALPNAYSATASQGHFIQEQLFRTILNSVTEKEYPTYNVPLHYRESIGYSNIVSSPNFLLQSPSHFAPIFQNSKPIGGFIPKNVPNRYSFPFRSVHNVQPILYVNPHAGNMRRQYIKH